MKKVYIILTHTGTALSRLIKSFTKDEFSHSSIALDVDLKKMYSFGRLNPYNPFIAGFVHETINKGTFKRFYHTQAKVYSLEITDEQYEVIEKIIKKFEEQKEKYKFNILGLFAVSLHRKIKKDYSFYCAEFVKYVLESSGIKLELPEIIKPEHFKNIKDLQEIYSGYLNKYSSSTVTLSDVIRQSSLIYRKKEGVV